MAKASKTRNHIGSPGVAQNRSEVFKDAIAQYNDALSKGFYLEAITICESLITDRMESRIGELTNSDVQFDTLNNLKSRLVNPLGNSLENENSLISLYDEIVSIWAPKRNKALHQVVKISKVETKVWADFQTECEHAAKEGMEYFRRLDNELRKIRG
jgi:hypothetical protein